MSRKTKTYNCIQQLSASFLILTLLWLTVSIPFVFSSQQQLEQQSKETTAQLPYSSSEEEATNPFGTNTEEKAPGNSSTSLSEEYLHDHNIADRYFSIASRCYNCEDFGTYLAYHGELLVPPPNVA